jgi:drug/metabolite transporter (DMT)-like permease
LSNRDPAYFRRGYLYAFLAAILGGMFPTLSKVLLQTTGPVVISGLVFFLSGAMLIPYQPKSIPRKGTLSLIVAIGIIGAAIAPVFYQYGVLNTTAVNASLLSNGEIFFTSIIAFLVFGERLERRQLWEGMLILAGIVVVSTNLDLAGVQFIQGLAGNLLIIASMFFWSVENNLSRIASQRLGPWFVTKYRNLIGGGVVLVAVAAFSLAVTVPESAILPLAIMVVGVALTSLLAIAALGRIGAVRTLLVFSTTSIFGAVFALIFLGEQITAVQIAGAAIILSGVYLIQRSERSVVSNGVTTQVMNQSVRPRGAKDAANVAP